MSLALKKTSLAMLALLSVLPAVVSALNTTVTLTADATAGTTVMPTSTEVVTFGLPLVEGDVLNISEIRVLIGGVEQLASIEAGLIWHWSDNSLRSVTIQLQGIDMTGGDITVTIDDAGNSGTQVFVPHSDGWELGPASKANMPFPRIFALHDLDYLASTSLIPPYLPGSSSEGVGKLQFDQFDNGYGGLDFAEGPGSQAAFLFDRATAMIKVYMTTGEVKFLKEGFMVKHLYYTHVRDDGTAPAPPGGDGCWTFGSVACADGKYIYTEPAKLAWALFGDNSQWDNALIIDMAIQADLGFNQPLTSDPYDVEGEAFTERAAGIVGLAEINAYEITGDVGVLATMNSRLDSLKDMQQVEHSWDMTNGWTPRSGAFTHSWLVHEIDAFAYPGDGTTNDRRFSPWMSENIVDFLWQVYHVFEIDDTDLTLTTTDIGEMLRLLGNAIDLYGFTSEYQAGLGLDASYATKPGLTTISMSCTAPDNVPVSLLYSGSSVASAAAIAATAAADGGFADQHNVETILSLGLAFYFETDPATRNRLFSRVQHMEEQWLRNGVGDPEDCSAVFFAGAIRLFNWQHRSNSVRTWDWILGEVGGIYDVKPDSFSFTGQTSLDPDIEVTSNAVTIAGLGTGASANVATDMGTLVINGIDCASSCSVQNADTMAVKVTTAGTSMGSITSTVTIGTFSTIFLAATRAITLDYPGWVWVAPGGCADGQSWHFECTGLWVDGADVDMHPIIATCTVTDGLTCANFGVNRRWTSFANLTLASDVRTCSVEPADLNARDSCAAADRRFVPSGTPEINNPDAFFFTAQIELATSLEVTSNEITIAGLGAGVNADASTDNGILVINTVDCGGPCTVANGNTLAVKLTSSHLTGTTVSATVTVGAFSTDFDATTSGPTPDTTPANFAFPAQTDLDTSIAVTSAAVTIADLGAGIDTPTSTDNGTLVIAGVDCTMNCLIMNGETLAVRITTSAAGSTTVTANVTVGTFSTAFDATTTIGLAAAPGALSFTAVNNAALNQSHDSNAIVFDWLNANTGVTTTAGILLINGNPCVAACTVDLTDTIALRLTSAGTNVTLVSATVTVDGISGDFTITTQAAASAGGSDSSLITGNVSNVVVTAGQLVTNMGVINSVELAAGSIVDGGTVTGAITGSGTLKNARIDATSIDPSVIVGQGSKVTARTVSNVSDLVLTDALRDDQGMLQLSQPLVVEDDGNELSVLDIAKAAIDELFGNGNTDFANGTDDGTLELSNPDLEGLVVPITPISVQTTNEPDSVSIANAHGEFIIVSNGIKTTFAPAAADLAAFQAGIDASGAVSDLLSDGSVSIEVNGSSFSLRFSLVASMPPSSSSISFAALTNGEATFSEQGSLSDPATYRVLIHYPDGATQEVLPAIHDISVFDAWLAAGGFAAIINGLDGTILFQDRGFLITKNVDVWRGIPSYGLLPPVSAAPGSVDFLSTTDLNGDGIGDIYFDTDTARQVIYGLPLN